MPLYSYACAYCGPFTAMRALAEFQQPTPCPACGEPSERTLSVPRVLGRAQRRGQETADAPRYARVHGPNACGCCG